MTATISVSTPRRKDFDAAVGFLADAGATYDPSAKTWTLDLADGQDAMTVLDAASGSRAHFYAHAYTIS